MGSERDNISYMLHVLLKTNPFLDGYNAARTTEK